MRLIQCFAVVLSVLLSSCSNRTEISESEKRVIVQELQNRLDEYSDAFKKKNLDMMLEFWAKTQDFAFASDGRLITEYDSVYIPRLQNHLPKVKEVPYFGFNVEKVAVLSMDIASAATSFDWAQILTSGDTIKAKGTWLFVFKKMNDQWNFIQSAGTHIRY